MAIKLFILGRPGSGKSTAYRHIKEYLGLQYKDYSIIRYNDYETLHQMFLFERHFPLPKKPKQFCDSERDGFDVLDFRVLDTALKKLETRVRLNASETTKELVIIEFARQNYKQALKFFSPSFLKDAYFIFLDADIQMCIQRVKERVTVPPTLDNHFVSEEIIRNYYVKQIIPSPRKSRMSFIDNNGDLRAFQSKIEELISAILTAESSDIQKPPPRKQSGIHTLLASPSIEKFML